MNTNLEQKITALENQINEIQKQKHGKKLIECTCGKIEHAADAIYCTMCGIRLDQTIIQT